MKGSEFMDFVWRKEIFTSIYARPIWGFEADARDFPQCLDAFTSSVYRMYDLTPNKTLFNT